MHNRFAGFLCMIVLLAFSACTAGPKLKDYPLREIDRPYTLPKGLATWSGHGLYQHEEESFYGRKYTYDTVVPPIPLFWRQSLSDDWNLVWAPIPLAAMVQIRKDKKAVTGLSFGPMLKCCTSSWAVGAHVEYSHRQILNETTAMEIQPKLAPWIPGGKNAEWDFQASVLTGVLFQTSDVFALRGGIIPLLRRDPRLVTSGSFGSDFDLRTEYSWRLILPIYAGFNWTVGRQWDIHSQMQWQKIGEQNDYSSFTVLYGFTHYW